MQDKNKHVFATVQVEARDNHVYTPVITDDI